MVLIGPVPLALQLSIPNFIYFIAVEYPIFWKRAAVAPEDCSLGRWHPLCSNMDRCAS